MKQLQREMILLALKNDDQDLYQHIRVFQRQSILFGLKRGKVVMGNGSTISLLSEITGLRTLVIIEHIDSFINEGLVKYSRKVGQYHEWEVKLTKEGEKYNKKL